MKEKIAYTLNVQVVSGPKLTATNTLEVDAYDKITVAIAASTTDKEVTLAGQVQFLMVMASTYKPTPLTYKVNNSSDVFTLDTPQILTGQGAVKLLDAAPTKLLFSNASAQDIVIEILTGRDATPTS